MFIYEFRETSKTSTRSTKPTRMGRPSREPNIQNLLKGARITFRIERPVLPSRDPIMVTYFHIQHTNGANLSLAFLKCLQFTITLLLITNRYWFSYSQTGWRIYRSDFHGSQRCLNPVIHHPAWIHSYYTLIFSKMKFTKFIVFEFWTKNVLSYCFATLYRNTTRSNFFHFHAVFGKNLAK